ncbi:MULTISPECIES: DNA recombination protein RmuC [Arthrobacter]|uniref:DNA recombination protein RmuC n=2 Tax=Arthrobacter TaxID=1663 RepID=A0ABU9KK19_9MICC|nr:DNA recombination protein RmuC [Arthrobacter sp. YJM1]MDP5227091.1 DNA recombination protein RmuC [Arthrobacter sp. YJM1]
MDNFLLVLLLVILSLAAGAAGGFLWGRSRNDDGAPQLRAQLRDSEQQLGAARESLADARARAELLERQNLALSSFDEQENTVLHALAPVAEKLAAVQQHVAVLERDRQLQFGQLSEQLNSARVTDQALLESTRSLASALRNNASRGRWGEVQLRRVVEAAGLLDHVDFHEQFSSATGEASVRPDLVVQLPQGKYLVVDSKVPLSSFLEAQEAGRSAHSERRADLMKAHAKAVRTHIDALAAKRYWDAVPASPELVICFLPAESFLAAALEADPGLLDYGFGRNVTLASPATLMAVLKAVAVTWRQELLTENAKDLYELSQELYTRLGTMGGHITKMGSSLKSSVEHYNRFVGTLETRVLTTARKMTALNLGDAEQFAPAPALDSTPRVLTAAELLDDAPALKDEERAAS